MKSTPFLVGGQELSIRYENKQQQDIKHNAPKKFFPDAKGLRFKSSMELLNHLGDTDIEIYLLQKGLEWSGSGIGKVTEEVAGQLRQDYLEEGEADSGEKYEAFVALLADALSLNVIGASGKKLQEKAKITQEKTKDAKIEELAIIYEAQKIANERYSMRKSTNESPSDS